MRLPNAWNDRMLLEDEPFNTFFYERAMSADLRYREGLDGIIAQRIQNIGQMDSVQRWLELAFSVGSEEKAKIKSKKVEANLENTEIFVRIYWLLYQKDKKALDALDAERAKKGYGRFVPPIKTSAFVESIRTGERDQNRASITRLSRIPKIKVEAAPDSDRKLLDGETDRMDVSSNSYNELRRQDKGSHTRDASWGHSPPSEYYQMAAMESSHTPGPPLQCHSVISILVDSHGRDHDAISSAVEPVSLNQEPTKSSSHGVPVAQESVSANRRRKGPPRPETPRQVKKPKTDTRNVKAKSSGHTRRSNGKKSFTGAMEDRAVSLRTQIEAPANLDQRQHNAGEEETYEAPLPEDQKDFMDTADSPDNHQSAIPPVIDMDVVESHQDSSLPPSIPDEQGEQCDALNAKLKDPPATSTLTPSENVEMAPLDLETTLDEDEDEDEPSGDDWDVGNDTLEYDETMPEMDPDDAQEEESPAESVPDRPRLTRPPPIWAVSRQEVCESFDWFRSYQSGVYHSNSVVKGYLLSAFASERDVFHHGGRLIISHGGGKAESLRSRNGQRETRGVQDQLAQDKSVRALIKNHLYKRPLVLLIDDKYAKFPYNLRADGYTYAVLGFYKITHAWAEYQSANNAEGRVIRYKFAFQWCLGQGEPWWTEGGLEQVPTLDRQVLPPRAVQPTCWLPQKPAKLQRIANDSPSPALDSYQECCVCQQKSPSVYEHGWMCLAPECSAFWLTGGELPPSQLTYSKNFLELVPLPPLNSRLEDFRPRLPRPSGKGIVTTYAFTRGWHCHKCGRLSSRYKWEHWECANCKAIHKVPGIVRAPNEFWGQHGKFKFTTYMIGKGSGIDSLGSRLHHSRGEYQTFVLPDNRGKIHVILGKPLINQAADKIFEEYQQQANDGRLLFRRLPLRNHKLRGAMLTNYFSQNSGEPYQYVGGTIHTVPFDRAPSAVVQAKQLIELRVKQALGIEYNFNEVLSAGYMERQRMSFHSDAERGLGEIIASLSLGSGALMHFRLHARYDSDREIRGSRNALTLFLRHGDVMVMEGSEVQEFYEHTVIPLNFRIAATARYITPAHLPQLHAETSESH